MIKLVYLAIVGAIYLYNAYQTNQKKRQAELKKQEQNQPQPNTVAPPPYEQKKPVIDAYKQAPREQTPLRPKPIEQPRQQKKAAIKPSPKAVTATAASSIQPRAEQPAEANIHDDSLQQANNAYAFTTDLESYVFNPRDAVIASIILQRPEY